MPALEPEAFAAETAASTDLVRHLVDEGVLDALPDGRIDSRDAAIVSTVCALLDAGLPLDDIVWAVREGRIGFGVVGRLFMDPAPRATRSYAEFVASLGDRGEHLHAVYAALGLPEPLPTDRLRTDEEELVGGFVELWSAVDPTGEAHARVARLIGDATRRVAEGWLDVWDATARPDHRSQGAPTTAFAGGPPADPADPDQNPTAAASVLARRLVGWMHERQVERTLHDRIINAVESILTSSGRLQARTTRPPAIAFVDLSGFTTLTEQIGDDAAARMAAALHELADEVAREQGGRVVKQLGDGVLMRFASAEHALRAIRLLMPRIAAAGLPDAHAGIAAGPVITRDGDVFGRTVNLASRLAATALADQVLVEEGVVVALPAGTARFEPLGRIELRGVSGQTAVWRVLEIEPAPAVAQEPG
jgi:adenylate cyclase